MRLTLRTLARLARRHALPFRGPRDRQAGGGKPVCQGACGKDPPGDPAAPADRPTAHRGPTRVDPNIVASYLDNELDPDQVAELEKKCLTSDVHLAEVASVHQILSLIGQKAKVPTEARHRMYHLIKGREAVKPRAVRASLQTEPSPVSEPVQPWVTPPPPPRPWIERFGPVAAGRRA